LIRTTAATPAIRDIFDVKWIVGLARRLLAVTLVNIEIEAHALGLTILHVLHARMDQQIKVHLCTHQQDTRIILITVLLLALAIPLFQGRVRRIVSYARNLHALLVSIGAPAANIRMPPVSHVTSLLVPLDNILSRVQCLLIALANHVPMQPRMQFT
jgi:hypothetical protein